MHSACSARCRTIPEVSRLVSPRQMRSKSRKRRTSFCLVRITRSRPSLDTWANQIYEGGHLIRVGHHTPAMNSEAYSSTPGSTGDSGSTETNSSLSMGVEGPTTFDSENETSIGMHSTSSPPSESPREYTCSASGSHTNTYRSFTST